MPSHENKPKRRAGDDVAAMLSVDDFDRLIERHRQINAVDDDLRLLLDDLGKGMEPAQQPEEKQIGFEQR